MNKKKEINASKTYSGIAHWASMPRGVNRCNDFLCRE